MDSANSTESTSNGAPAVDSAAAPNGSTVDSSAEAELAAFYYLIVTCSQATSVHDDSGALVLFNPSCTSLLGYERGELSVMESPNVVHPDDASLLSQRTELALTSGDGRSDARLRLVRKDGDPVPVDLDISTVDVADRRFLVIVSTPTDHEQVADRSATWAHAFG